MAQHWPSSVFSNQGTSFVSISLTNKIEHILIYLLSILISMVLYLFTKMGSYQPHYLQVVFSSNAPGTSLTSTLCLWCGV